jgi:transcription elongation factor GreA
MVGSTEASSLQGKMSNESPVGKAILGHKKGETVKVETKAGKIKYKILDVYVDKKKK